MFTPSRLAFTFVTAAVAATIAACGDATAPRADVAVEVAVSHIVGPNVNQAPQEGNRVACEVTFNALATGKGRATWGDATFKWFVGKDRSTPVDSSSASAADVRRAWSDTSIAAGGRQTATWTVWANVPFSGAIDFHYSVGGGEQRTATVAYDCGPAIVAGADRPSIIDITTQSLLGPDLEPGGVLKVTYTANSPLGVWQTAVLVSGPCEIYQEFDEPLLTSVSRAAVLTIPADCELGAPVDVTIYATDATLDRKAQPVPTTFTLIDKTRPWLRGATVPRPTGPYFTGDTVDFVVSVGDNNVVRSIVWEARPFGARDSVVSPARGLDVKVRIPVKAGWSGPMELRYVANDATGLVSDTIVSTAGTVAVYPTTDRPTTSMAMNGEMSGSLDEVVDVARNVVYLRLTSPSRIAVMSLASMQIVSTIPLPLYPASIDLTPSNDSLLVAFPELSALGVIDLTRTDRAVALVALAADPGFPGPVSGRASEVRVLANGKAFAVVNFDPGSRRLFELDLATGAQRYRFEVGTGGFLGGINVEGALLSPSQARTMMSVRTTDCIHRYDTSTDQFGPCVATQALGVVNGVDATGQRFAVGPDIYDASWRHLRRIEMLPAGTGFESALTPDGRDLYFPFAGSLVRASAVDGRIVNRQKLPVHPSRVRMSPDGRFVMVAGTSVNTGYPAIAVVDIR